MGILMSVKSEETSPARGRLSTGWTTQDQRPSSNRRSSGKSGYTADRRSSKESDAVDPDTGVVETQTSQEVYEELQSTTTTVQVQEISDPPGRITNTLILSIFAACLGNAFLFGWHISVVNQPFELIKAFFNDTYYVRNGGDLENDKERDASLLTEPWVLQLVTSMVAAIWVFFGMIGALLSAKVADYFGRKKGMLYITAIMCLSAVIGFLSKVTRVPELLIVCRLVAGIHTGLCINLNSMYISEISPTEYRGSLGTMFQLSITIGILFVQILGLPDLLGTESRWPFLFLLSGFPAVLCGLLMPFCPESPSYLLVKAGDETEARKALVRLRGTDQVDGELARIQKEADESKSVVNYSVMELLKAKDLRRNVIIACFIMFAQQWSGINAVFTYSTLMFELVNIADNVVPYMVVVTGVVNVILTVVAVPLMEKAGRRNLLIYPTMLATLSFVVLTVVLLLQERVSEELNSVMGGIAISMFMTYIIGFAIGLGPVPFIVVCEIFKQEPRAAAMSLAMVCNWVANFILTLTFPTLNDALGPYVNLPFVGSLVVSILFFWKYVPETKGKSFEEIDLLIKGMVAEK